MPGKMARSVPRSPFGLPGVRVAVCTLRQSCSKAGKARRFTADRQSSGESRLTLVRESSGECRLRPSPQRGYDIHHVSR
jgi:hypothetical protein